MNQNGLYILKERYLWTDPKTGELESPEQLFQRVAETIAMAESTPEQQNYYTDKFYNLLNGLYFLPNTPCLINAGKPLGQLFACFVLPVDDSMEGIFDAVKYAAIIHKSGGGTGFSFSRLREHGAVVNSTGRIASGPVVFMEVFDSATETVKQGGVRRGANMGVLRCDHPDIFKFITAKQTPGKFTNFNLSIALTDRFMESLEQDEMFDLVSPKDGQVKRQVKAAEIMAAIVDGAWSTGEPGIIFIDTINRANPVPHLGDIESTNPSLRAGTKVITGTGVFAIEELEGKTFPVYVDNGDLAFGTCFKSGVNKRLWEVSLDNGETFYCTPEHKWPTKDGKKPTEELTTSDFILKAAAHHLFDGAIGNYTDGFLIGSLLGGGNIITKGDNGKTQYVFCFSQEQVDNGIMQPILDKLTSLTGSVYTSTARQREGAVWYEVHTASAALHNYLAQFGELSTEHLPAILLNGGSVELRRGFIDGLLSTGGHIVNHSKSCYICFTPKYEAFGQELKDFFGMHGIHCNIQHTSTANTQFPDKDDKTFYRTDLRIGSLQIERFLNLFSLTHKQKMQTLQSIPAPLKSPFTKDYAGVVSVRETDIKEDVWDIRVNHPSHCFQISSMITGNCGEVPLLPFEACILGSINLGLHVKNRTVDWTRLEETTRLAVRFLDNCIEVSATPLPQISEMMQANRKIGLGVMGWADMLLLLGIKYDSDQALSMVDEVMGQIYQWADDESRQLGQEKGPFPNAHLAEEMARGRRNATVTTIAPTGTISIIAGASSGIEPLFGYSQVSKRKIVTDVLFEMAQPVKEYCREFNLDLSKFNPSKTDLNQALAEVVRLNTYLKGVLPDYFVTTHDIKPEWHIKMQAAFQQYTDNAVSKTINLPQNATKKDVEQAYLLGYKLGVKGLTVYRDGSRDEQVIYTAQKRQVSLVRPGPDRMTGERFKVATEKGETAYITVSKDEQGLPFEVFANSLEGLDKPYEVECIFRLVSLALRANIPVVEVCRQLEKSNRRGHLHTIPALIKRVLLMAAGAEADEGTCLHCGGIIRREGGCVSCPCGQSSKCD